MALLIYGGCIISYHYQDPRSSSHTNYMTDRGNPITATSQNSNSVRHHDVCYVLPKIRGYIKSEGSSPLAFDSPRRQLVPLRNKSYSLSGFRVRTASSAGGCIYGNTYTVTGTSGTNDDEHQGCASCRQSPLLTPLPVTAILFAREFAPCRERRQNASAKLQGCARY